MGISVTKSADALPSVKNQSFFKTSNPVETPAQHPTAAPKWDEGEEFFIRSLQSISVDQNNEIPDGELLRKYPRLEKCYAANCNAFAKIVASEDPHKHEKLKLLHYSLEKMSGLIAKAHGKLLSDDKKGKEWLAEHDRLLQYDKDHLELLEPNKTRPLSFSEQFSERMMGVATFFKNLFLHPIETFRTTMRRSNWWRQLAGHIGEIFTEAGKWAKRNSITKLSDVVSVLGSGMGFFGLFIYASLLLINTTKLVKHTLGIGVEEEEKNRPWYERFMAHWRKLRSEIGNDLAWLVVNTLAAFVLAAKVGTNIAAGFLAFDFFNSGYSLFHTHRENKKMERDMEAKLADPNISDVQKELLVEQKECLVEQIKSEKRKARLAVGITGGLMLAGIGVVTAVAAVAPHAPLIAAIAMTVIMGVEKILQKIFAHKSPPTKMGDFKPAAQDEQVVKVEEVNDNGKKLSSTSRMPFITDLKPKENKPANDQKVGESATAKGKPVDFRASKSATQGLLTYPKGVKGPKQDKEVADDVRKVLGFSPSAKRA